MCAFRKQIQCKKCCAALFHYQHTLNNKQNWSLEIHPKSGLLDLRLKEFWQYKDLIGLFVKRELVPTYKQTILGPLWFILQPLLTTIVYSIVFGMVARIPTGGLPQILFYMPGIVLWNLFNTSFLKCSAVFISNTHIFGKVYFPRLVIPVSGLLASMVNFSIQLGLFLAIFLFYKFAKGADVHPNLTILLSPIYILILALYALGMGMIVSSLTTRYRDLNHFLAFGTQLLMYATPIIYPVSIVPDGFRWIILLNPLCSVFEAFRYAFLGSGMFDPSQLFISLAGSIVVVFTGLVMFKRAERTSIDTV